MRRSYIALLCGVLLGAGCSEKPAPVASNAATNAATQVAHINDDRLAQQSTNGLTGIQQYPTQKPLPAWLGQLKPQDQAILLPRYQREVELTNKLALTIALAFIGDELVVSEFKNTLFNANHARPLNANEENTILFTVEGLGLLARRHNSAWELLSKATDPPVLADKHFVDDKWRKRPIGFDSWTRHRFAGIHQSARSGNCVRENQTGAVHQ